MKKSINDNIELVAPSESNLIIKEYSDKITHLLISVPPSDDGDPFLNNFNKDLQFLKNLKFKINIISGIRPIRPSLVNGELKNHKVTDKKLTKKTIIILKFILFL